MMSRPIELHRGALVGRFRVACEIGRGGHGLVYQAHDTLLGREVALKTLCVRGFTDAQVAAAQNEARLLSQVDSPYVTAIHDLVTHGDSAVLVMELVNGPTLAAKIQEGPLPWEEIVGLGVQLATGLCALHEAGIVHRDIKPSNIRLSRTGLLKILDLGVAQGGRAVDEGLPGRIGAPIVGTIPYMSPEQLRGCPADARSDIYGSGCVLYELTTGRRLFDAPRRGTRTRSHAHRATPSMIVPDIPCWLEQVIFRAVDPNPDTRFQTARELLAAISSGANVPAARIGPTAPAAQSVAPTTATFEPLSQTETASVFSIAV